jgi:hypothetical protein
MKFWLAVIEYMVETANNPVMRRKMKIVTVLMRSNSIS